MVTALAPLLSAPQLLRVTEIGSLWHAEWRDADGMACSILEESHIEIYRGEWNEDLHRPSHWGRNYARCLVEKSGDPLPRELLAEITTIALGGGW